MNNIGGFLVYFAYKYKGDYEKIYEAIKNKEQINNEEVQSLLSELKYQYITLLDGDYPDKLKTMPNPPFVIFYDGNKQLLQKTDLVCFVINENTKYSDGLIEDIVLNRDDCYVENLDCDTEDVVLKSCKKHNKKIIYVGIDKDSKGDENTLYIQETPPEIVIDSGCDYLNNRLVDYLSNHTIEIN